MKQVKTEEWSGILVYLECIRGKVHQVSLELLGEAWRLARQSKEPVYAVGMGQDMEAVKEQLAGYPLQNVFLYETEDEYDPLFYDDTITACIQAIKPSVVLVGGTPEGRTLAPRLAVFFESGLTADCTTLEMTADGNLIQTRPAFGGNVMASIMTEFCRPQFATVRPGVMTPLGQDFHFDTICLIEKLSKPAGPIRILHTQTIESASDITKQKLLVVAGRGVQKKADLQMLRDLAALLGGRLASTRALVEKGWMSPKEQIGLSGNVVSPAYMITCGVSGTVQFMAGMKQTKNIIAINKDPNAPIFEIAHFPVCGDIYEIIPELLKKIREKEGVEYSEAKV